MFMMKSRYKLYVKASFSFDPTEFDSSEISGLYTEGASHKSAGSTAQS
jgi:hypothetical protein